WARQIGGVDAAIDAAQARVELFDIDAAAPDRGVAEALQFELLLHCRRRHHDAAGLAVKRVHVTIAGPERDPAEARGDVFRKLRVIARRERKLVLQADGPRVRAQRAFG